MSDEELLEKLLNHRTTKKEISTQYLGYLPRRVYQVQIAGSLQSLGFADRTVALSRIIQSLPPAIKKSGPMGYVFIDHGTFSKQVSFVDPLTDCEWGLGKRSESVVLYAFVRHTAKISHADCIAAVESLLSSLSISSEKVLRCDVAPERDIINAQRALDISASSD